MSPPQTSSGGARSHRQSIDPAVRALQIEELFRFAGMAAAFSYFGCVMTFLVLWDTGDLGRGSIWFFWATAITFLRFVVISGYRRRSATSNPETWVRLAIVANLLAGIQWGILGTLLFPPEPGYRQLFTIMMITCFVGGSLTAYASVRWAHEALSLPATIPTAFYLFFVQDGVHLYAGLAAFFFCFAIAYYALKLNRHMTERFRLQVELDDLLTLTGGVAEKLSIENRELAHRVAVRASSSESAREQAERLGAFFRRSAIPMVECDHVAHIIACNPAAERLLGEREEELQGRPLGEHLAVTGRMKADNFNADALLGTSDVSTYDVEVMSHGVRIARAVASFTRLPSGETGRSGYGVIFAAAPR